mmetsp:Transcript_20032/g.59489  ORF Transcript_20032/g.59489 Transcript_20032/m.59489 type:complete len:247 (-) Transcript_20032:218-958(-)
MKVKSIGPASLATSSRAPGAMEQIWRPAISTRALSTRAPWDFSETRPASQRVPTRKISARSATFVTRMQPSTRFRVPTAPTTQPSAPVTAASAWTALAAHTSLLLVCLHAACASRVTTAPAWAASRATRAHWAATVLWTAQAHLRSPSHRVRSARTTTSEEAATKTSAHRARLAQATAFKARTAVMRAQSAHRALMQARVARTSAPLVATASTSLSLAPRRAYCAPAAHGAAVVAPLIAPPTAMAT